MLRKNLPVILVIVLTLLMIWIVIWVFGKKIKSIENRVHTGVAYKKPRVDNNGKPQLLKEPFENLFNK